MRPFLPAVSVLAGGLLAAQSAQAGECKRVDTTIVTFFFTDGCTSPVGICTAGKVRSGPLEGTTKFQALTVAEGPTPDVLVYTGELVITTRKGTVTIRDAGVLNGTTAKFVELQQIVSGTQGLRRAKGVLTSRGVQTATGFSGTLKGFVCQGEGHGRGPKHDDDVEDLEESDAAQVAAFIDLANSGA